MGSTIFQGGTRRVVSVDVRKKTWEQKQGHHHNRWHPDIPHVDEVKVGEVFRVEMLDFSGGAIQLNDSAHDIKLADHSGAA